MIASKNVNFRLRRNLPFFNLLQVLFFVIFCLILRTIVFLLQIIVHWIATCIEWTINCTFTIKVVNKNCKKNAKVFCEYRILKIISMYLKKRLPDMYDYYEIQSWKIRKKGAICSSHIAVSLMIFFYIFFRTKWPEQTQSEEIIFKKTLWGIMVQSLVQTFGIPRFFHF